MDPILFLHITPPAVILFILGFGLLIFEMFHPGFGAAGVTGIIALIIAIAISAHNYIEALIMFGIIAVFLVIAFVIVLRSLNKGRLSKKLVLSQAAKREEGFVGTEDLSGFLNQEGVTLTVLRPAGTADFSGTKLDVVSESEFIPKDTKVIVNKVEGRCIVVRPKAN
jgi:membrane-bound ClpP family serine protease